MAVWLDAFHDPVANVDAYSECLGLADLDGYGEVKLVVADARKKLRVLKDTSWEKEIHLLGHPSALVVFYNDTKSPRVPLIAVAGPSVWLYRRLRPYFKIPLPPITLHADEEKAWKAFEAGDLTAESFKKKLKEFRDQGVTLSPKAVDVLSLGDSKMMEAFATASIKDYDKQPTYATCMETIPLEIEDDKCVSVVIVGTESKYVLFIEPKGFKIDKKVTIPSVPVTIACSGVYEGESRVVVACRDGKLYTIRKGILIDRTIALETPLVDMCIGDKEIVVATMDNAIYSFAFKGTKNYSIYLPSKVTNIAMMTLTKLRTFQGLLVATGDGEIRLYKKRDVITSFKTKTPITGMIFGPYGRESGALALLHTNKAVTIKILRRQAKLEITPEEKKSAERKAREVPLPIPRKTKLYVEQTKREQDQAVEMHSRFQRDLCKLRLTTARAYVKVLENGQGPISAANNLPLHLDAQVQGLGPCFKIKLAVKNTGIRAVHSIPITVVFDSKLYHVPRPLFRIATLVPGPEYTYDVDVISIDENGGSAPIRIYVCNTKSCVPLISAVVDMPIAELAEEDE